MNQSSWFEISTISMDFEKKKYVISGIDTMALNYSLFDRFRCRRRFIMIFVFVQWHLLTVFVCLLFMKLNNLSDGLSSVRFFCLFGLANAWNYEKLYLTMSEFQKSINRANALKYVSTLVTHKLKNSISLYPANSSFQLTSFILMRFNS